MELEMKQFPPFAVPLGTLIYVGGMPFRTREAVLVDGNPDNLRRALECGEPAPSVPPPSEVSTGE